MSHYTFWMQGCTVSRSVHPRRSRGPGPGSIQRRLGHTGGICWVQPGPTLRLNPRRAVAIIRHTPHSSSEKVNTLIRFRMLHEQGVTIAQVHFTVDVLFAVKKKSFFTPFIFFLQYHSSKFPLGLLPSIKLRDAGSRINITMRLISNVRPLPDL